MLTLATLGPSGSDSENAARLIVKDLELHAEVLLFSSFEQALEHASTRNGLALVPAAYQQKDPQGNTKHSWADLNFKIETDSVLQLWAARVLPLKKLALAKRKDGGAPNTVTLHPATQFYAETFLPSAKAIYVSNKPDAVRRCSEGFADACLGSLDVVDGYSNLEVIRTFGANMCWTIYRAPDQSTNNDRGKS